MNSWYKLPCIWQMVKSPDSQMTSPTGSVLSHSCSRVWSNLPSKNTMSMDLSHKGLHRLCARVVPKPWTTHTWLLHSVHGFPFQLHYVLPFMSSVPVATNRPLYAEYAVDSWSAPSLFSIPCELLHITKVPHLLPVSVPG